MTDRPRSPFLASWSLPGKLWLGWFVFLALATLYVIIAIKSGSTADSSTFTALMGYIVFLGGPASIGGWLMWFFSRRRRLAMEEVCRSLNLTFRPKVPWKELMDYKELPLFSVPTGEIAASVGWCHGENLMQGKRGDLDVMLFDYRYFKQRGSQQAIFARGQTVAFFPQGAIGLPQLVVVPRKGFLQGFLFGLADRALGKDNCFEFYEEYQVGGSDAVFGLFTFERMQFLANHPGWTIEINGSRCVIYQPGKKFAPRDCPALLAEACQILTALRGR
jgi:hypothetical protein